MNEKQLTIVKKFEIIKPLNHKIGSIFDNCYRGCQDKYFHTFKYRCIYCNKITNIGNNERTDFTISDKNMCLYQLNKKIEKDKEVLYLIK